MQPRGDSAIREWEMSYIKIVGYHLGGECHMLSIRNFSESDILVLIDILKRNGQFDHPAVEGRDAMKRVAKCSASVFLVAEEDNRVMGLVRGVYDGSRAMIHQLSVDPNYQGRGVGRALLDAVCKEFRKRNAPTVSVTVTERSGPFWEKLGFKRLPVFLMLTRL